MPGLGPRESLWRKRDANELPGRSLTASTARENRTALPLDMGFLTHFPEIASYPTICAGKLSIRGMSRDRPPYRWTEGRRNTWRCECPFVVASFYTVVIHKRRFSWAPCACGGALVLKAYSVWESYTRLRRLSASLNSCNAHPAPYGTESATTTSGLPPTATGIIASSEPCRAAAPALPAWPIPPKPRPPSP